MISLIVLCHFFYCLIASNVTLLLHFCFLPIKEKSPFSKHLQLKLFVVSTLRGSYQYIILLFFIYCSVEANSYLEELFFKISSVIVNGQKGTHLKTSIVCINLDKILKDILLPHISKVMRQQQPHIQVVKITSKNSTCAAKRFIRFWFLRERFF